MKKKVAIIASVIVAALAIIAIVVFKVVSKDDAYRLLKVFEFEGEGNVMRGAIGDIEPYENMVLESGDEISLVSGKFTIKADEDKYIYLEDGTTLYLNASGDAENSKTTIQLIDGAITNEIQNKLSLDSSYEVNTPNSTMSVRGTIFRVCVYEENGIKYTKVCVFDGGVDTALVFKDSSGIGHEVRVEKGKEVIIFEDDTTVDYVAEPTDIDYEGLPTDVLETLLELIDEGKDIDASRELIEEILNKEYTVTFTYNGNVFGTQTIKRGDYAVVPTLQPAPTGSWAFDFDTRIEKDTEIEWN